MPDEVKARELRARLDAIAPKLGDGDVTADALARYFGVSAQERWTRQLNPAVPFDGQQVALMLAEWGLAHVLLAFGKADPWVAGETAAQIRDALGDGGAVGQLLFEDLGGETAREVASLTGELIVAAPPADQVTASRDDVLVVLHQRDHDAAEYGEAYGRLAKAAGIEVVR